MAGYKVFFKASVEKDFRAIPKDDLRRIVRRIGLLGQAPRPFGSEKLTGEERYRIRQGRYRIVYSVNDADLAGWVVKVGHRRDVYRFL